MRYRSSIRYWSFFFAPLRGNYRRCRGRWAGGQTTRLELKWASVAKAGEPRRGGTRNAKHRQTGSRGRSNLKESTEESKSMRKVKRVAIVLYDRGWGRPDRAAAANAPTRQRLDQRPLQPRVT